MSGVQARVETFSLLNFKRLAEKAENHAELIKDPRIISYVERGLDTTNEEVVATSVNILEILVDNSSNLEKLKQIGTLRQALEKVVERRFGIDPKVKQKAEKIIRYLDGSIKPLGKEKLTWPRKVITLHVHGLHSGTRKELEDILTKKIKGVLTVLADVEHQRCILTVYSYLEPKEIAQAIHETGYMSAYQVLRNAKKQEILVPLIEEAPTPEPDALPEYLDEEDELVAAKAVKVKDFRTTASEWFLTTAGFIQRSVYW